MTQESATIRALDQSRTHRGDLSFSGQGVDMDITSNDSAKDTTAAIAEAARPVEQCEAFWDGMRLLLANMRQAAGLTRDRERSSSLRPTPSVLETD
jgi:hypothetical protein